MKIIRKIPTRLFFIAAIFGLISVLTISQTLAFSSQAKRPTIANLCVPRNSSDSKGYEVCYYYNNISKAMQYDARGAEVTLSVEQPKIAKTDFHSLAELAISSKDRKQTIEAGWKATRNANGSSTTRLFVYFWVNKGAGNQGGQCYDLGCGFVHTSKKHIPGMVLTPGTNLRIKIIYNNERWEIFIDDEMLGYYPTALWGGMFTRAGGIQAFGEVASSSKTGTRTDMGNGIFGTRKNAATIKDLRAIGTRKGEYKHFNYSLGVKGSGYKYGGYKSTCEEVCSMRYGGPGTK